MERISIAILVVLIGGAVLAGTGDGEAPVQPQDVAAAYFAALQAPDLDAAGALFAGESSIFETGGVEGTWQHYREHHLGPEVDAIAAFTIRPKEPEVTTSEDATLAVVTWPIEYTISLKDKRTIESRGTVTFVLVRVESSYSIRHLHWSSRRITR